MINKEKIREFKIQDLDRVMELWLTTNKEAHNFIEKEYWENNFEMVKEILPNAEIYVLEINGNIKAFIGIMDGHIAGIFVDKDFQSQGIGNLLLEKAKSIYDKLSLAVYLKNEKAIKFYEREGFKQANTTLDQNTNEYEVHMEYKA